MKNLTEKVKEAKTRTSEGRQMIVVSCRKLYNKIETKLYEKYGEDAVIDAYKDLCEGNFAEPFMCEQKKAKFTLYSNIFNKI